MDDCVEYQDCYIEALAFPILFLGDSFCVLEFNNILCSARTTIRIVFDSRIYMTSSKVIHVNESYSKGRKCYYALKNCLEFVHFLHVLSC